MATSLQLHSDRLSQAPAVATCQASGAGSAAEALKKTGPAGPDRFPLEQNPSLDIQAPLSPQNSTRARRESPPKFAALPVRRPLR